MDRKVGRGVQETKKEVYKKTSVSSTRLKQKNKNGSKCVGLYNEKGIIYRV